VGAEKYKTQVEAPCMYNYTIIIFAKDAAL
jgi:hypothetical protein